MYDPNANASPFQPIPPVIVVLVLIIAGIECFFQLAENGMIGGPEAIGWRFEYARQFGYNDAIVEWMLVNKTYPSEHLIRFVTFNFIHVNFMHALFVCVFTAAMGKFVAQTFHPLAVLAIFLCSALLGVIGYSLILNENALVIGGYPAAFGLIGAFTWIKFSEMRSKGFSGFPAFRLIVFFMIIQLIFKFAFGGSNEWLAELLGFFVGFVLAIFVEPGGWRKVLSMVFAMRRH